MDTPLPWSVLEAMTYPHDEASLNFITDADLQALLPLDLRQSEAAPAHGIGLFQKLPTELISAILEQLPLLSLVRFRNLSHSARFFVDSIPKFRLIMNHAPQAIRGILAIQTKIEITLPQLYKKLCQRYCDECAELAQRIWIPTVSRLCQHCAASRRFPLTADELIAQYGVLRTDLPDIPSFYFLPATLVNCNNRFEIQVRHTLYDSHIAASLILERTGQLARNPGRSSVDKTKSMCLFSTSPQPQPLRVDPKFLPMASRKDIALIDAPWLSANGAEFGVFCANCLYHPEQDRMYTRSEFQRHMENCRVRPHDHMAWSARKIVNSPRRMKFHFSRKQCHLQADESVKHWFEGCPVECVYLCGCKLHPVLLDLVGPDEFSTFPVSKAVLSPWFLVWAQYCLKERLQRRRALERRRA